MTYTLYRNINTAQNVENSMKVMTQVRMRDNRKHSLFIVEMLSLAQAIRAVGGVVDFGKQSVYARECLWNLFNRN